MPITDLLERNSKLYGDEVCLVEINPEVTEKPRVTWKEFDLIQPSAAAPYRREITWNVFDEKANRVANMLLSRGVKKGQKVAILLMNCLEWLPIYFGILKAGAVAVPSEAILTANGEQYVYVVENDAAKRTAVKTGLTGDGVTEVLSGLKTGEKLVVVGQQYLSDGDAVRVVSGG